MDIQDQAYKFLANIREGGFSKLSPLVAQVQREGLWSPFKDSIVPGITVVCFLFCTHLLNLSLKLLTILHNSGMYVCAPKFILCSFSRSSSDLRIVLVDVYDIGVRDIRYVANTSDRTGRSRVFIDKRYDRR